MYYNRAKKNGKSRDKDYNKVEKISMDKNKAEQNTAGTSEQNKIEIGQGRAKCVRQEQKRIERTEEKDHN